MFLHFPYHYFIGSKTSIFQAFLVPLLLSLHISLGHWYEPVSLIVPVTLYGFSYRRVFTNPHLRHECVIFISKYSKFRPVHSQFRQFPLEHPNHRYFIDPSSITTRPPLVRISCEYKYSLTVALKPFDELITNNYLLN